MTRPVETRPWTRRDVLLAVTCALASCAGVRPRRGSHPRVRFVSAFGGKGAGEGRLHGPIAIACSPRGELFVTEVHNARVSRFDARGVFQGAFALPPDGENAFGPSANAGGIAVDDRGHAYVSFMSGHKIVVFGSRGDRIREWGEQGAGEGQFDEPGGIALAGDTLYVADQVNRRVQKFTREGEFLGAWGEFGTKPGQFDGVEAPNSRFGGPHYLALNDRGEVYATEGAAGRVQRLAPDGTPLAAWGRKGDGPGGFGAYENPFSKNSFGPIGVCTDRHGRVWVSSLNGRVQLYTSEGEYLTGIGRPGARPGEFVTPHAMVVDAEGFLYVVDSGNHRVQKLEVV